MKTRSVIAKALSANMQRFSIPGLCSPNRKATVVVTRFWWAGPTASPKRYALKWTNALLVHYLTQR